MQDIYLIKIVPILNIDKKNVDTRHPFYFDYIKIRTRSENDIYRLPLA